MAAAGVVLVFHLFAFLAFFYSTYYEWFHVDLRPGLFDKLYFLTFWNACLQTMYYGLCFVKDCISDRGTSAQLQRWRDYMHAAIAFPLGTFVVTSFWALFAIDRELVFPKAHDHLVPFWLNHMVHTAVFPFLMVDKFIVPHVYPRRQMGILGSCAVAVIYIIWLLFIAYYENFWVYPVLQVLAMHERIIFIAVCCVVCASFYVLGEFLTNVIWRKGGQAKASTSRRKTK
ncbi:androgen-induced protein 1 [Elysia marginata]|uniref:Androgen-induced protein 1 n=1 Tax=Elysia marginata TaxID=1093978 RepID=A0AAV4F4Q9_9GAST|nr:androgen-induced protein 1 [Elysia marginata]